MAWVLFSSSEGLNRREVLSEVTACLVRPEDPGGVADCTPVTANSSQEEEQWISSDLLSPVKWSVEKKFENRETVVDSSSKQ